MNPFCLLNTSIMRDDHMRFSTDFLSSGVRGQRSNPLSSSFFSRSRSLFTLGLKLVLAKPISLSSSSKSAKEGIFITLHYIIFLVFDIAKSGEISQVADKCVGVSVCSDNLVIFSTGSIAQVRDLESWVDF